MATRGKTERIVGFENLFDEEPLPATVAWRTLALRDGYEVYFSIHSRKMQHKRDMKVGLVSDFTALP